MPPGRGKNAGLALLVVAAPCPWQAAAARSRRGSGRSSRRWWSVRRSGRASPTRKECRRRDLPRVGAELAPFFLFLFLFSSSSPCSTTVSPSPDSIPCQNRISNLDGPHLYEARHGGTITVRARPTRPRNLRLFFSFSFWLRPLFHPGLVGPGLHSLPESELELGRAPSPRGLAPLNNDRLS